MEGALEIKWPLIPRTIQHAIGLCRLLNERYL
jgi:hypothetical protein